MAETTAKARHRLREKAGLCLLCTPPIKIAPAPICPVPTVASFSLTMNKIIAYLEYHQKG